MSRITRDRIEPGDAATSSDLNTRYSDYTQTDLNVDNANNPAFDQAHLPSGAVLINAAQGTVGQADIAHSTPGTIAMTTSGPAVRTPIANPSLAVGGGSGWTISSGTILRVYFNLQSRSVLPASPAINPSQSGVMGALDFSLSAAGQTLISIGAHCWLVQLQWNLTSSALNAGDFVAIPSQGDFQSNWSTSGKRGEPVSDLAGTAAMPAFWAGAVDWKEYTSLFYPGLKIISAVPGAPIVGADKRGNGWRNITGSWSYPGGGQTVYGFRLVVHGVYHPYNNGTDNGLVLETAFPAGGIVFNYSLGNILAMHMRAD